MTSASESNQDKIVQSEAQHLRYSGFHSSNDQFDVMGMSTLQALAPSSLSRFQTTPFVTLLPLDVNGPIFSQLRSGEFLV
jgi:hypothetical protein